MTTLAETIRQRLADDILRGVYPPGARLDENGLATGLRLGSEVDMGTPDEPPPALE